jgi:hypothetical protein
MNKPAVLFPALQSNNNPVWLGLTCMMDKYRTSNIKEAAILSIGEHTQKRVSISLLFVFPACCINL